MLNAKDGESEDILVRLLVNAITRLNAATLPGPQHPLLQTSRNSSGYNANEWGQLQKDIQAVEADIRKRYKTLVNMNIPGKDVLYNQLKNAADNLGKLIDDVFHHPGGLIEGGALRKLISDKKTKIKNYIQAVEKEKGTFSWVCKGLCTLLIAAAVSALAFLGVGYALYAFGALAGTANIFSVTASAASVVSAVTSGNAVAAIVPSLPFVGAAVLGYVSKSYASFWATPYEIRAANSAKKLLDREGVSRNWCAWIAEYGCVRPGKC